MTLRDEIFEQAEVLEHLLQAEWTHVREIAQEIQKRKVKYIFLAARGTSDNAGLYAKYLLGIHNNLPVALAAPSMFSMYGSAPRLEDSLVLAISQSGQSPDIVNVVEEGRRQGAMTLTITNSTESPLAKAADHVLDIRAGAEKAVAATKSYTAQLMAAAMLSAAMNGSEQMHADLQHVPGYVSQVLGLDAAIARAAERYFYVNQIVVVGRGYNYATAYEWALKLEEMTYIIAEAYSAADFLHGPIAMVELGFPVFVVAPSGQTYTNMLELAQKLKHEKQANLLILSDKEEILQYSPTPIRLPANMPEWVTPIVNIVPAQLFCKSLAELRGLDTENPRGLSKVTLTE